MSYGAHAGGNFSPTLEAIPPSSWAEWHRSGACHWPTEVTSERFLLRLTIASSHRKCWTRPERSSLVCSWKSMAGASLVNFTCLFTPAWLRTHSVLPCVIPLSDAFTSWSPVKFLDCSQGLRYLGNVCDLVLQVWRCVPDFFLRLW